MKTVASCTTFGTAPTGGVTKPSLIYLNMVSMAMQVKTVNAPTKGEDRRQRRVRKSRDVATDWVTCGVLKLLRKARYADVQSGFLQTDIGQFEQPVMLNGILKWTYFCSFSAKILDWEIDSKFLIGKSTW